MRLTPLFLASIIYLFSIDGQKTGSIAIAGSNHQRARRAWLAQFPLTGGSAGRRFAHQMLQIRRRRDAEDDDDEKNTDEDNVDSDEKNVDSDEKKKDGDEKEKEGDQQKKQEDQKKKKKDKKKKKADMIVNPPPEKSLRKLEGMENALDQVGQDTDRQNDDPEEDMERLTSILSNYSDKPKVTRADVQDTGDPSQFMAEVVRTALERVSKEDVKTVKEEDDKEEEEEKEEGEEEEEEEEEQAARRRRDVDIITNAEEEKHVQIKRIEDSSTDDDESVNEISDEDIETDMAILRTLERHPEPIETIEVIPLQLSDEPGKSRIDLFSMDSESPMITDQLLQVLKEKGTIEDETSKGRKRKPVKLARKGPIQKLMVHHIHWSTKTPKSTAATPRAATTPAAPAAPAAPATTAAPETTQPFRKLNLQGHG